MPGNLFALVVSLLLVGAQCQFTNMIDLSQCEKDLFALTSMKYSDPQTSALMLDSMAKSVNQLGKYDDCLTLKSAHYCLVTISNVSSLPDIFLGLCVPSSCDEEGLSKAFSRLSTNFTRLVGAPVSIESRILVAGVPFPLGNIPLEGIPSLPTFTSSCSAKKPPVSALGTFTLGLLVTLALLAVIGSFLDHYLPHLPRTNLGVGTRDTKAQELVPLKETPQGKQDSDLHPLQDDSAEDVDDDVDDVPKSCFTRESLFVRLILAFSIQHNVSRLVVPSPKKTQFLDGIRTLSMFYVILGHTTFFMIQIPLLNPLSFFTQTFKTLSFQIIMGGFFAVDTFYFLSGLLVTLALLPMLTKLLTNSTSENNDDNNDDNKEDVAPKPSKVKVLLLMYFHRWLRLSPLYLVIIWIYSELFVYLGDGPLYYSSTKNLQSIATSACRSYWWSNLLYINNFVPWKDNLSDSCLQWGWYLSNDMQFFVATPFLLSVFVKSKKAGIVVTTLLFLVSYALTGLFVVVDDIKIFSPQWMDMYYTKPWTRIPPYIIGVMLGLVWKEIKIKSIPTFPRLASEFVAFALLITSVFGTYTMTNPGPDWSLTERFFYFTFSRTAFVSGLALISFLIYHGHMRAVSWFLSFRLWSAMARLTFAAYLVHPLIIITVYQSTRAAMAWDPWAIALRFCGFVVLSYGSALVLWLLVEKPLFNFEKEFMPVPSQRERGKDTKEDK